MSVGFFSSPDALTCIPPQTQRTTQEIRSRNAPVLAALAIEQALLRFTVRQLRERAHDSRELADQFDHHQARVDVLLSQVETL